jgi:hypothetical protein
MEVVSPEKLRTVTAKSIKVQKDALVIFYQGKQYSFSWKSLSKKLAKASQKQRENFVVSPSGYGIHWAELDEDISIHALLKSKV